MQLVKAMVAYVAVSVLVVGGVSSALVAQEAGAGGSDPEQWVRVEARRLEDGRTEFALRLHDAEDGWAERILPDRRFFPVAATTGRWLVSSPMTLNLRSVAPDGAAARLSVRITARLRADGRIEFGLQQRRADGEWGEHLLAARRMLPVDAHLGRWLVSSPLTVAPPRVGEFSAGGGARSGETLIAASFRRTCAVEPDGGVICWGEEGTRERLSAAVLEDVLTVSIGDSPRGVFHTCALHRDATVSCWGPGTHGELGMGDTADRFLPVKVPGIRDAVAIAAGAEHTCAVHVDGSVSCWGDGSRGQLGDGGGVSSLSPRVVPGLSEVVTIAAGPHRNCAVHRDGGVACWGWGATTRADHLSPRTINGLGEVVSVAVGWLHTCAVRVDGQVYCWPFADDVRPARVSGIGDAVAVSVGDRSFCALHRDGGVSCWGENNSAGQLGNGTTRPGAVPIRLTGLRDAVAVTVSTQSSAGESHACAVHVDGSVSCWGSNAYGQLGDGTHETRLRPARVREFTGFSSEEVPEDPTEFLRTWIDRVVEERQAEFPWLRLAWDHARDRTHVGDTTAGGGYARFLCHGDGVFQVCVTDRVVIRSMRLGVVVHELAHVYDHLPELVSPRAWGAAQLYFAATHPDCYTIGGFGAGSELLADTMEHLVIPTAWLTYYNPPVDSVELPFDSPRCETVGDEPTEEAEAVVRAALAGEVPDWYTENISSGADLWAAIRRAPSVRIMLNLKDEFGGFCSLDWLRFPLEIDDLPPEHDNQFRDGGC